MVHRITIRDRLRYNFDKTMAAGPMALIGWLALVSLSAILVPAAFVTWLGITPGDGERFGFLEAAWVSLIGTLDSGAMGGYTGWPFRIVMFAVTLTGLLIVSSLIGVMATGVQSKLDELRKGRSFVIETDHTLILGWAPYVFTIISELAVANANRRNPRIVILAHRDKVEMEDDIRSRVGPTGRTQVICRTGSPLDLHDVEVANPHAARSIIVVSPEADDADSQVIKSILALTNNPRRRPERYHIVAEIRDPKNAEAARLVGRDEAQFVFIDDFIARITVQAALQPGMSVVYTELLDFGGDEIYFKAEPGLVGKTFGEALLAYEDSAVIGLRSDAAGVRLNPPMDTPIGAGDKIIAIAADDDRITLSALAAPEVDHAAIVDESRAAATPWRTLVLGWNRRAWRVIRDLDGYAAPGSQLTVVGAEAEAEAEIRRRSSSFENQAVACLPGDITDRRTLDGLDIAGFNHVIVLSYSDRLTPQEADARTLISLLHLRDIAERRGRSFNIVSEMMDVRNREIAAVTRADDFVVSDKLTSLVLAQLSENKELGPVLADLLDPEGSEMYMKPAAEYVRTGQPVSFYTVVAAARQRGEVAIGFRQHAGAEDAQRSFGVVLNPRKSDNIVFDERDLVVVLAES